MTDTFRKNYNTLSSLHAFEKELKTLAEAVEEKIKLIGVSRETSLAMTNLEQAVMWAVKALYKRGD